MLPWLIDLGLGVVDLGLAAAAVAMLVEGLPGAVGRRSAVAEQADADGAAAGGDEDDEA